MAKRATVSLKDYNSHYPCEERQMLSRAWTLCLDWYDGTSSAMHRLVYDYDVPISSIVKELDLVIASEYANRERLSDVETAKEFKEYCQRLVQKDQVRAALAKAIEDAKKLGMKRWQFQEMSDRLIQELEND